MKKSFSLIFLVWLSLTIHAQNVTKKCKTCNKPIAQCIYKGNHSSSTIAVDNSKFLTDYSKVKIGDYFYTDGTYSHSLEKTKKAIGVVFSLETSKKDQARGYNHGYIIALNDAKKGQCYWGPIMENIPSIPDCSLYNDKDPLFLENDLDGLTYSNNSVLYKSPKSSFLYLRNVSRIHKTKTSEWFVPAVGQWIVFLQNLCNVKVETYREGYGHYFKFNMEKAKPFLSKYHIAYDEDYCSYWTSNELDEKEAYMIVFLTDQECKIYNITKETSRMRVRGIAAF